MSQTQKMCGGRSRQTSLFVRSAQQVVHELQVREEVEGMRQEVREVKGESKVEENRSLHEHMWMTWMTNTRLMTWATVSVRDVTMCRQTRKNRTRRTHTQEFVLSMWKSVEIVMSSLVFASCNGTTQSWPILNFHFWSQLSTCCQAVWFDRHFFL